MPGDRVTVTVHLPVDLSWFSEFLMVLAKEFPGVAVDTSGENWHIECVKT